jgi:tripartite-type tricarboxylate transporter receptor subunit TctC
MQTSIAQIEAENISPLAVFAPHRLPGRYGNIPTLKEAGYNLSCGTFGVIIGPPRIPQEICERLVRVFETASNDEGYQKYLAARGCTVHFLPPDQAYRYCEEKREEYRNIMKKAVLILKE